jgi:F-type H+-transporting ATPase subunit a
MLTLALPFALESEPLAAQKLFELGGFSITNSMLFGLVIGLFTLILLGMAAARSQKHPRSKLAFYMETLVDGIFGVAIDSFNDRKKALKHLPLLVTLFTFIFISNLSGLLPGVGTLHAQVNGQAVPLLRAFTTDLNATLALAILTIGLVQFYAIRELGILGHLKHYFTNKPWKPVNLFIGVNEVFGELLRIVTLSMRLFGVIYAGEVLITTIAQLSGNFAWFATLPVLFLEIFFSAIQAYVFMMLTTTYLAIATSPGEHQESTGGKVKLQTAN